MLGHSANVCRWHNLCGSHHQEWWDQVQEGNRHTGTTTNCWMWARPRRLLSISGEVTTNTHQRTPMVLLWREWAASNPWGCTSVKTSPGPQTLHHWQRKHNSAFTSSSSYRKQGLPHSQGHFLQGAPLRTSLPAYHHCVGLSVALTATGGPCSTQWTQLGRSLVLHSPLFKMHTTPASPEITQSLQSEWAVIQEHPCLQVHVTWKQFHQPEHQETELTPNSHRIVPACDSCLVRIVIHCLVN